jgi:hypothetical protein
MKSHNLNILKSILFSFIITNCHEGSIKSQEISPESTKSFQDKLIDSWFGPHERENIIRRIQTNLIWQKRLAHSFDSGNSKKFKKELASCDEAIGLRQFICPIYTPLIAQAVFHGRIDDIEQMIKYGFDPNAEFFGATPLNIALKRLDYSSLNVLLTSPKIDVNKLDSAGFSPLNIAMMTNNPTQLETLLDHGATTIDPKTTIFNIDLKNCKTISPSIKNLIFDYSERNKIARTAYQRWVEKQL